MRPRKPTRTLSIADRAVSRGVVVGEGGTADVYAAGLLRVVKVPHRRGRLAGASDADIDARWAYEASVARQIGRNPIVPKVKLTRLRDGTPALMVERLRPVTGVVSAKDFRALESAWDALARAGWETTDEVQIGRDAKGRLKVYDIADWHRSGGLYAGDALDAWSGFHLDPWAESRTTVRRMADDGHPWLGAALQRRRIAGLPVS
jgi:hypothetical protein